MQQLQFAAGSKSQPFQETGPRTIRKVRHTACQGHRFLQPSNGMAVCKDPWLSGLCQAKRQWVFQGQPLPNQQLSPIVEGGSAGQNLVAQQHY